MKTLLSCAFGFLCGFFLPIWLALIITLLGCVTINLLIDRYEEKQILKKMQSVRVIETEES